MGDMNIDMLKFSSHTKSHDYTDNMSSLLITKPTRVSPSTATLIDHIYYNRHDKKLQSGILLADLADHFGIFCKIQAFNQQTTMTYSEL